MVTPNPTDREQTILKMVVEDFIETATPVPSKRLKDKFHITLSSASIRKVLYLLECNGLLNHVYTSSGKVPTDSGYRFYVDELMEVVEESEVPKEEIMKELAVVAHSVEEFIQVTADSLAKISNLFGFVLIDFDKQTKLTALELVRLSSGRILFVLGFQSDQVRTVILNLSMEVAESHINTIAQVLHESLVGLTINDIQKTIGDRLKDQSIYDSEIIQILVENPENYFTLLDNQSVYTSQKDFLFKLPEFSESDKILSMVSVLDNEKTLVSSILTSPTGSKTQTSIGQENINSAFQTCSVVKRQFIFGNLEGYLGVIGPTRMAYRNVHSLVDVFSKVIFQL